MTETHIAKLMWDAYAIQAGGKTFDGKPLPTWDELGEDRQSCWIAAASVATAVIKRLEAALRVYAEEDHWFGDKFEPITFPEGECVCCYEHFSDQGEIARKALEGKDD
jgi:hypothetical protein